MGVLPKSPPPYSTTIIPSVKYINGRKSPDRSLRYIQLSKTRGVDKRRGPDCLGVAKPVGSRQETVD
ncbi:hypothetical protein J6590_076800 [Homalodisca vitripennis]|nr:hypothetical protein J6590_076800 [Homalodisca vitripennis]